MIPRPAGGNPGSVDINRTCTLSATVRSFTVLMESTWSITTYGGVIPKAPCNRNRLNRRDPEAEKPPGPVLKQTLCPRGNRA